MQRAVFCAEEHRKLGFRVWGSPVSILAYRTSVSPGTRQGPRIEWDESCLCIRVMNEIMRAIVQTPWRGLVSGFYRGAQYGLSRGVLGVETIAHATEETQNLLNTQP